MSEGQRLRMSEYLLEVAKWGEETSVARGAAIQTAEMVEDDLKTRHRSTFFCLLLYNTPRFRRKKNNLDILADLSDAFPHFGSHLLII